MGMGGLGGGMGGGMMLGGLPVFTPAMMQAALLQVGGGGGGARMGLWVWSGLGGAGASPAPARPTRACSPHTARPTRFSSKRTHARMHSPHTPPHTGQQGINPMAAAMMMGGGMGGMQGERKRVRGSRGPASERG